MMKLLHIVAFLSSYCLLAWASDDDFHEVRDYNLERYLGEVNSKREAEDTCPQSHPYAYRDGRNCCANDREDHNTKRYEDKCDDSTISLSSACCEDYQQIRCPAASGNCGNYDGTPYTTDPFGLKLGVGFSDGKIVDYHVLSWKDCAKLCRTDAACRAWTYQISGNRECRTKSSDEVANEELYRVFSGASWCGLPPVNGGYGDWKDWSSCSKDCGGGTRSRSRDCTNPTPARGGADCDEEEGSEVEECNTHGCGIVCNSGTQCVGEECGCYQQHCWKNKNTAYRRLTNGDFLDDYHCEQDKHQKGYDIATFKNIGTVQDCATKCDDDDRCVGFEWNSENNKCWLSAKTWKQAPLKGQQYSTICETKNGKPVGQGKNHGSGTQKKSCAADNDCCTGWPVISTAAGRAWHTPGY